VDIKNRWVHFRIRDVYIPEPQQLLTTLHGEDLLQGRVIEISEGPGMTQSYAVVEVEGLEHPVIVPSEHVLGVL
jgi:hypothetical protein